LETRGDLPRVHAGFDDFHRDEALDRLGLLGHPDRPHAAFADLLDQLIRAHDRAGPLTDWLADRRPNRAAVVDESLRLVVGLQEGLDFGTESRIAGTGLVEKLDPFGRRCDLDRREEDRLLRLVMLVHRKLAPQTLLRK